jgi:radical SAM superfamily enzyme YgiQ (UPF0313 family)
MYLSAGLKAHGHDCEVLIGSKATDFIDTIEKIRPDLIAFSVMTGMHTWAVRLAGELKKRHPCPIILGGPHPTFFPEIIQEKVIDLICRGEGEGALLDLADALAAKQDISDIANLWVKCSDGRIVKNDIRPLEQNLDILACPDRELYARYPGLGNNPVLVVTTSRGCPYDCTFCFNHQLAELYKGKGRFVRHRSPASVIDEIERNRKSRQVSRVYFADDTFSLNRAWLEEFLPLYGKSFDRLPFHCLIRINQIDDPLATMLRENGCESVFFGIESGDERFRNAILGKAITDDDIRRGAAILKKNAISFRSYNIVGFPGETFGQALQTVQLNIDIKTDFPWCSIFMPYPGTRLAEYAREQGYLDDLTVDSVGNSFHRTSILLNPDRDRLINLHKFFQTAVLCPPALPLIKLLTKLPVNNLFQMWFNLVYFYLLLRSEGRNFWQTVGIAVRNRTFFQSSAGQDKQ